MKRVILVVAYDGTNYSGFAAQKNPEIHTIEGELNRALRELTGENIEVIGASRTDAGVHARCNYAVFDTSSPIPPANFAKAANTKLPEDIRIQGSWEVNPEFHPRKMHTEKTYEYRIYCSAIPDPVHARFYACTYWQLDVAAMQRAAKWLVGEHDFASFANPAREMASTVREITRIEIEEKLCSLPEILQADSPWRAAALCKEYGNGAKDGERKCNAQNETNGGITARNAGNACDEKNAGSGEHHQELPREIIIRVSGKGFLYNMVRIIAGTLIRVGRGMLDPDAIPGILEARDRQAAGETAPACGLHLVNYALIPGDLPKCE